MGEKMTLELRDEDGELVAVWKLDESVDVEALARNIQGAVALAAAQARETLR